MAHQLSEEQKERNRLFNQGFADAYEKTECNLELYETSDAYMRGYNSGEDIRERDIADQDPYVYNLDIEDDDAVP